MSNDALWVPSAERAASSNVAAFAASVGIAPLDYWSLHRWSVEQPNEFWSAIWRFCGIVGEPGSPVTVDVYGSLAALARTRAQFFPQDGDTLIPSSKATWTMRAPATVTVDVRDAAGAPISCCTCRSKRERCAFGW